MRKAPRHASFELANDIPLTSIPASYKHRNMTYQPTSTFARTRSSAYLGCLPSPLPRPAHSPSLVPNNPPPNLLPHSLLTAAGGDGVVHTWDMRTRRCVGRMVDFGNKDSASLALAQDGRWVPEGGAKHQENEATPLHIALGKGPSGGQWWGTADC